MKPKKHHYIPRFYLEGFVDPSLEAKGSRLLWVYEAGKKPWKASPENCGFEKYFYVHEEGRDRQSQAEEALAKLDGHTAPVLRRLGTRDFRLSAQEREEFAGFVALMVTRTPYFHDFVDTGAAEMTKARSIAVASVPGALESIIGTYEKETGESFQVSSERLREFLLSDRYRVVQTSRTWTLKVMFQEMLTLMPVICDMRWSWLISSGDQLFLTSDNPVALYDPVARPPYVPRFKSSPHAQFTFPITSEVCLYCTWRGDERIMEVPPSKVRVVNKRTIGRAYRYVFAPELSLGITDLIGNRRWAHETTAEVRGNS